MAGLPTPTIPVSWGELIDKITILEIKRERIARADARANVEHERRLLLAIARPALARPAVAALADELGWVNEQLWDIEDAIRRYDAMGSFGVDFVALAQSVYRQNDKRAALKRRINALLESGLVEEKSYAAFGAASEAADALLIADSLD